MKRSASTPPRLHGGSSGKGKTLPAGWWEGISSLGSRSIHTLPHHHAQLGSTSSAFYSGQSSSLPHHHAQLGSTSSAFYSGHSSSLPHHHAQLGYTSSAIYSGQSSSSHSTKRPLPSAGKQKKMKGGEVPSKSKRRKTSPNANEDKDYIPITNAAPEGINMDVDDSVMQGIVEQHRQSFMERAFPPIADSPMYASRFQQSAAIQSCRSAVELDYIAYVVQNWGAGINLKTAQPSPQVEKLKKFRRNHPYGTKWVKQYCIEEIMVPGQMCPRKVVRRFGKDGQPGRIVVNRDQLFDAIDEWHRQNGHLGQERTWNYCSSKYYNITQDNVRIYCETCLTCMKKNPVTKNVKGSRKPIRSSYFRDRFQIDLIDFTKLRKRDPFGVLMRWIMTVKDHATGLTYICALPRKTAKCVAYELQKYFGLVGYPKIFHTDNGKEFTAKRILRFLRSMNPNIFAVTGRPRMPRDQGSVENVNKFVKMIIGSILVERRLAGENPNWTEILGSVMSKINSQHGRGKNDVSAFEAVFGQTYDHQFLCSKEEARKCWSIKQYMGVTSDQDFNDYVMNNFIVDSDSEDEGDDDDYFSDDELVEEEMEEVSDAVFDSHLFGEEDESDRKSSQISHQKSPYFPTDTNNLKSPESPPSIKIEKTTVDESDLMSSQISLKSPYCPPNTANLNSPESPPLKAEKASAKSNPYPLLSIADGWVHQQKLPLLHKESDAKDELFCVLQCDKCIGCNRSGYPTIIVGNDKYNDNLVNTTAWFNDGFIHGFTNIVNHDAHTSVMPYGNDGVVVLLVDCFSENEPIHEILPYESSTTHFVSVVFNKSHFVVLYYNLVDQTVLVFDGLRYDLKNWSKHIVRTIKQYGLVPLRDKYNAVPSEHCFDVVVDTTTRSKQRRSAVSKQLTITFEGKNSNPWTVSHDSSYVQSDSFNCGPIACVKVMEIFGATESGTITSIGTNPNHSDETYRSFVMNYYKSRIQLYDSDLKVRLRPLKKDRGSMDVDEYATDLIAAADTRNEAMRLKNAKQEASAEKEILRRGQAAVASGASKGAVVSLHVDYRTNAHAQGLVAIVYDVKNTGGILVCCEHGIITHDGSVKDYWVPADKYRVLAKYDDKIPLTDELHQVRNLVLTGTFNPTDTELPRISYSKLHEIMIGATSPLKRKKGCGCKGGRCGKSCGCKRNGMSCHSGCKCNGNC